MTTAHLLSPNALAMDVAARARAARLANDLSQAGLAARAGVTLGTLKRFERTGLVSLDSLLRIALALGAADGFQRLFPPSEPRSLDEILAQPTLRKRGRKQ